jgi:hypothetical protein
MSEKEYANANQKHTCVGFPELTHIYASLGFLMEAHEGKEKKEGQGRIN